MTVPVVIQAGRKGTRLYPYTKVLPKPLMPVGDLPILEIVIRQLAAHGFRNLNITIGYLGVHGQNLTRTRDINLFPATLQPGTLCADAACASSSAISYYRHPGAASPAQPDEED